MNNRLLRPRLIIGLFVIVAGLLFGLDEMGQLDASEYVRWWPAVLILLGALRATARQGHKLWAVGLMVAGAWFLIINLGWVNADYFDLWPLFLMGVGGALIYSAIFHSGSKLTDAADGSPGGGAPLSQTAILSGRKAHYGNRLFQGGNLTAALGGCHLDLSNSRIVGDEAVLDCVAFWGGIELVVPPDWLIDSEVMAILGGFEDKTVPPAAENAPRLRLTGYAIMGGIEVRNGSPQPFAERGDREHATEARGERGDR